MAEREKEGQGCWKKVKKLCGCCLGKSYSHDTPYSLLQKGKAGIQTDDF